MPRDLSAEESGAKIGPNAILQMLPVLEEEFGPQRLSGLMARLAIPVPDGTEMIPEGPAARLHQGMRAELGPRAAGVAARAGRLTADYILAHRIPTAAQVVLKALPPGPAARMLSGAIARHAWTFAGSGRFRVVDPWNFTIADNPVIAGEVAQSPLCHWHAAVFETLYRRLVHPGVICREVACAAAGARECRFFMRIGG